METNHYEGELYCVLVNYGKTNITATPPSATPCTSIEDPRVKHQATWKRVERPKKLSTKKPSTTLEYTSQVGKKRHSNHANNHEDQVEKEKKKRLKGKAGTTHLTVQTVEAATQPRRSQ